MFHQLATDLVLDPTATSPTSSDNPEHSQGVSLDGDDIVTLEAKLVTASGTLGTSGFTITLQTSNDLQNWQDDAVSVNWGTTPTVPSVRFASSALSISAQYARLRYELDADSSAISVCCSASLNTSRSRGASPCVADLIAAVSRRPYRGAERPERAVERMEHDQVRSGSSPRADRGRCSRWSRTPT